MNRTRVVRTEHDSVNAQDNLANTVNSLPGTATAWFADSYRNATTRFSSSVLTPKSVITQ